MSPHAELVIVIVDDDPTSAERLGNVLSGSTGASIRVLPSVSDVEAWLDSLTTGSRMPDLAVVDLRLPDGHGWDVAQLLNAGSRACPVIAWTAWSAGLKAPPTSVSDHVLAIVGKTEPDEVLVQLVRSELSAHGRLLPSWPASPSKVAVVERRLHRAASALSDVKTVVGIALAAAVLLVLVIRVWS